MNVDLEERTIAEQLKFLATYRGYTMKALCEEFNKRYGTKFVQQSFSKKLITGAVRWDELKQFGEILGFKVKLELIEQLEGGEWR